MWASLNVGLFADHEYLRQVRSRCVNYLLRSSEECSVFQFCHAFVRPWQFSIAGTKRLFVPERTTLCTRCYTDGGGVILFLYFKFYLFHFFPSLSSSGFSEINACQYCDFHICVLWLRQRVRHCIRMSRGAHFYRRLSIYFRSQLLRLFFLLLVLRMNTVEINAETYASLLPKTFTFLYAAVWVSGRYIASWPWE